MHTTTFACLIPIVGLSATDLSGATDDVQSARQGAVVATSNLEGPSGQQVAEAVDNARSKFVGREACIDCHQKQYERWTGSHHDLALQVANDKTVQGDFPPEPPEPPPPSPETLPPAPETKATFNYFGAISTFFKKDNQFFVNTQGADGQAHDYEVAFTIGTYPLQQYLVRFPGGRYQALSICWDARLKEEGGQGWFHLYPHEEILPGDELHWTGLNHNWNFMCAECHSTNLQKNYDLKSNSYRTTFSEIDVSCEACHGPGSRHLEWAQAARRTGEKTRNNTDEQGSADQGLDEMAIGLAFRLKEPESARWLLDPKTMKYKRSSPLTSDIQLETCARCHSHRHVVHANYIHGQQLLDTHQPSVLIAPLYHADGQIREEVYEYGSFLQSKMYDKGVRCTDCHDPHSLKLYETGNSLCARCHLTDRYDTPRHHFHKKGSTGAACVACHMPDQNFMIVDPRRDHSLRVPRPDLSMKLGTPNACNACHTDKDVAWAADAVVKWYGDDERDALHYGEVLHAGRMALPDAGVRLVQLAGNHSASSIVRATALSHLRRYPGPASTEAVRAALNDRDPLVRVYALAALEPYAPTVRLRVGGPRSNDPIRAVRIEAARILAAVPQRLMTDGYDVMFQRAYGTFLDAQAANSDRAGAHLNLGNIYQDRGWSKKAEDAFRTAIRIEKKSIQSYVNLADLYRQQKREQDCEQVLRHAIAVAPDAAAVHHALGMALVRQKRLFEAIQSLGRAAELAPEVPRMSLIYALSLNTADRYEEAMHVLTKASRRHPHDRDLLLSMATISRDRGDVKQAIVYAKKLVELYPHDTTLRYLLSSLEARRESQ